MIKKLLFAAALTAVAGGAQAQRQTDKLDRGVIAMQGSGAGCVTWRIFLQRSIMTLPTTFIAMV